jgi:hypothetical protein
MKSFLFKKVLVRTDIVERIDVVTVRQRRGKHVSTAMNQRATIELLKTKFSKRSVPYSAPRYMKTFGTPGNKMKSEFLILDGGRPGAGIPNILDE